MKTTIDLQGDWRLFSGKELFAHKAMGTITINGKTMALMKSKTNKYLAVSHDSLEPLDGRLVAGALGLSGPKKNPHLKRVNLMLDTDTIHKAKKYGIGNVSAGIRNIFKLV